MVDVGAKAWAQRVFGMCALGDHRRTRRLVEYAAAEADKLAHSTSGACSGNAAAAEGAYRFVRNDEIDPDAIAEGGFQATVEACRAFETVLAVEDSSTLTFRHSAAEELGDLGGKAESNARGFWVHSVLMIDAETERTIGLAHQQRWIREPGKRRGSAEFRKPTDAKESEKWELASECTAERMDDLARRSISVCDREADIYQYLAFKNRQNQRFVVRACNDRLTEDFGSIWSEVAASQSLGIRELEIEQRGGKFARQKRTALLTIRAKQIKLKSPRYLGLLGGGPITLWAVQALEESPPADCEPLEWMLLTSEPCADFEGATRVLRYYSCRWRIEEFHKAWKSGCGVEERRMQSADNLERVATILAFVAVRILQMNEAAAATPEASCETLLAEEEWKCLWLSTEKSKPPQKAPSTLWARNAIARLGGWLDTKRTGRVGWSTFWKGWKELMSRLEGFRTAKLLYDP
jgi:hypothetical protein